MKRSHHLGRLQGVRPSGLVVFRRRYTRCDRRSPLAATHQPVESLPLHALLLVVALVVAIAAQGAYYGSDSAVTVVLLLALVTALRARPWSSDDASAPPVWAGAALGAGGGQRCRAGDITAALPVIALLGGVVVVLLVIRRLTLGQRDALAAAVVVIGVLAAVTGWVGVAWRVTPWALEDQGLWRAATTLTYANAAAGLLVPLALLAVARSAARPGVPAAVAVCLLLIGAGATLSRGGALALVVGAAVLAVLLGPGRTLRAAGPPTLGAVVALAGLAPSMAAPNSPPRPVLAMAGLVVGVGVAVGASHLRSRRLLAIGLAAVVLAAGAVLAAGGRGGNAAAVAGTRLTIASPDRAAAARAALQLAAERPLTGTGPNRAVLTWVQDSRRVTGRYVHNEYLQVLAELGFVGLALLIVLLASLAWAVWRGRPHAPLTTVWAGAVAGLAALAVHSALDFLWHLPAIPLAGAVLAGLVLPTAIDQEGGTEPNRLSEKE